MVGAVSTGVSEKVSNHRAQWMINMRKKVERSDAEIGRVLTDVMVSCEMGN